jgi:hypothetical protein
LLGEQTALRMLGYGVAIGTHQKPTNARARAVSESVAR